MRNEAHPHHRRAERGGEDTFATEFLPIEAGYPEFVNADLIAAGLSPFQPEQVAP